MTHSSIIVEHGKKPSHAIIWLHGLGASGHDFEPIVPQLGLSKALDIRFIFPHAPIRSVIVNNGLKMPAWYDIKGVDIADKEDIIGMQASEKLVISLIEEQIKQGIRSENIILAGFSQGGAVALYTGIRYQHKLAGIMALSTYLPFPQNADTEYNAVNIDMPIMIAHGQYDQVVPIKLGHMTKNVLQAIGYQPTWHEYPMEHSVIAEEVADIGRWITSTFHR